MQNIVIGADHRGFLLKSKLIKHLQLSQRSVKDVGCFSESSIHYPLIAKAVVTHIAKPNTVGVLICGSGIGMSIAANRHQGIRAALCWNTKLAEFSRLHNNSNILILAADFTEPEKAQEMLSVWLETKFNAGRHQERLAMID